MSVQNVVASVTGLVPNVVGVNPQSQGFPTVIYIQTNDTAAGVTTAGYLNTSKNIYGSIYNKDQMALVYTTDKGVIWLQVSISAGSVSLVYPSETVGGVTFTGSLNAGNLVSVNTASGIIQDAGIVAVNVLVSTAANVMAAGSSIALDKGTGTESSHAVTINKQAGAILTTSLTTAGGATETITLTNSEVLSTSIVIGSIENGSNNATNALTLTSTVSAGQVVFVITNVTAATALNGTLVINFAVF